MNRDLVILAEEVGRFHDRLDYRIDYGYLHYGFKCIVFIDVN